MTLVDGQPSATLPVDDRALHYGDGIFETMLVRDGRVPLLERHLARLVDGCRRLGLEPPDAALLRAEVAQVIGDAVSAVVKLIVSRGSGARGYRAPVRPQARRVVSRHAAPEWPETHRQRGVRARSCATRLAIGGPLVGIKHLNRLEQVLARREWSDPDVLEGIMLDAEGAPTCGTMSNLFAVLDGALCTPSIDRCGVRGIARALIMERLAAEGTRVEERRFAPDALAAATELFVCNAVIGVWPVRELDGRTLAVGAVARRAQAVLARAGASA